MSRFDPKDPANLKIIQTGAIAFRSQSQFRPSKGALLERQGWEKWLKTLGAATFTREFAPIQRHFWEWNWSIIEKVRAGIPLEEEETVGFLPWPRETGKSSHVEWACIAEGCMLKYGYVVYLSSKLSQAVDHVVAIRDRIESEHVADVYPWMAKPKLGTHGNKFGWGQEFLMTDGGWAIRPIGADVASRGGKAINLRATLIVPDDYDELGDSPLVVEHKEQTLQRAILAMGTANTRTLVPQNPIHENSVVNRMLTGATIALAKRTVFGEIEKDGSLSSRPIPAVEGLVYEIRQGDQGPYVEIAKGESLWPGISIKDWERTINKVGPSAFMAEYQHDMTVAKEERVLPEYDDRVLRLHVITWSQFEAKYGMRRIPSDWPCDVGLDIGYTSGHKSAWTFLAKVPEASELSGSIFRYRGRTFTGVGIDEQAVIIRSEMWKDEQIEREFMSHEKLGERLVLAEKHGWHFQPCDSAKTAGVAQWRHYLQTDRSQPHPFHRDEKNENGQWKLGRPAWFDIVDDRQFIAPIDDRGLKRHRDGAFKWRNVPIKLTDKGLTVEQPAKADDDECFVAGTLITTARGDVPIEEISQKDVVLTRQGWYSVLACGKTKSEAEIWELTLSDGSRLSGTKKHPIWVAGYGWKPLSELRAGERLLSLRECDSIVTQTQSIGRTEHTLSRTFTRFGKALGHFMLNYGKTGMVKFQKTMQFITKIIIRSIMPTQILNFLPILSTAVTTETICRPKLRSECGQISLVSRNWQKRGIEVQQGENGIENTLRNQFVSLRRLVNHVNIAAASILRDGGWGNIALLDVSKRPNSEQISWQRLRALVWIVASEFIHYLTRDGNDALVVLRSEPLKQRQTVYNLSVSCQPEYFANGVLVHNCDSTRMLTVGFGPVEVSMTPAQRLHSLIPRGYYKNEVMTRADVHPNQAYMAAEMAEWLAKKTLKQDGSTQTDPWGQPLK